MDKKYYNLNLNISAVDVCCVETSVLITFIFCDFFVQAAWKEIRLKESHEKTVVLRNARVTQRPQLKFLDKIDNSSTPFDPRITEKPNALKPLAVLLESLPNEEPW